MTNKLLADHCGELINLHTIPTCGIAFPILIFDEAAFRLDGQSEQGINHRLGGMADKTIIATAHGKSALSLCDRVDVMDQGRMEENAG